MHPEVAKAYQSSSLEYILRSEDRVEAWFEAITSGQPRTVHIDAITRHRAGGYREIQEYLSWHQTTNSNDEYGNHRSFATVCGRYELPQFEYQYDTLSKKKKAVGISNFETKFDIPFSIEKLEEFEKAGMIDGKTSYCVNDGSTLYSVTSFNEFKNSSHEDLAYSARTGLRPGQTYEQVPRPGGAKR
jgi:hypothetical protein